MKNFFYNLIPILLGKMGINGNSKMKFREWLEMVDKLPDSFANDSGIGKSSIYRYCTGESIPQNRNIKIIENLTNQQVTRKDFYDQALEHINRLISINNIRLKMLCPILGISEVALLKKLNGKANISKWEFDAINSEVKQIIKNKKENKHG